LATLLVFAFAGAGAGAAGRGKAILERFEGKVEVFSSNLPVAVRAGMRLAPNDIVRAIDGTALIRFPDEGGYGAVAGAAIQAGAARRLDLDPKILARVAAGQLGLAEALRGPGSAATGAAASGRAPAQPRGVNLVLILDVSTSMRGAFNEMQDYIFGSIEGGLLGSGDWLGLYTFGERVTEVYAGGVELPEGLPRLREAIYGMAADEEATDIGLMLARLDGILEAGRMPNPKTSVVWATDGKNNPPPGSPYAGKDIFAPGAFKAYTVVKDSAYKVLLLSIGADTAAKDLSGPLGGSYVEVGRDVTASRLGQVLGDFTGSIDLVAPGSIRLDARGERRLTLGFVSGYGEAKSPRIESVLVSVDGSAPVEALPSPRELAVGARDVAFLEIGLPDSLPRGGGSVEISLRSSGAAIEGATASAAVSSGRPFPFLAFGIGTAIFILALVSYLVLGAKTVAVGT
jgi:hypothetical protein